MGSICVRSLFFSSLLIPVIVSPALAQDYYNMYSSAPSYAAVAVFSSASSSVASEASSEASSDSSSSVAEDDGTDDDEDSSSSSSAASFAPAEAVTTADSATGWSYRYCTVDSAGNEFNCFCSLCDASGSCSYGGC